MVQVLSAATQCPLALLSQFLDSVVPVARYEHIGVSVGFLILVLYQHSRNLLSQGQCTAGHLVCILIKVS